MSIDRLILPTEYCSPLNILDTEIAIKIVKDSFERNLAKSLNLTRVSAPLFVDAASGLNDDLNGIERPVSFDIMEADEDFQIVQSLAKWKRVALKRYGFGDGTGLYTDMNAIRRDEQLDNLHSVYVDQWDWEKIISRENRNIDTLKSAVVKIVRALKQSENNLIATYGALKPFICEEVHFISSQELEDMFPQLTPKQREDEICRLHKTVFIMQIGGVLKSGSKHDGRAPDYDDWSMNGDLMVWYPLLDRAIELSSMGIRVDSKALDNQLKIAGCDSRRSLPYHSQLLNDELPLTMGGGIGQSRMCMVLLQKAHIGEVQASSWTKDMIEMCAQNGINLL